MSEDEYVVGFKKLKKEVIFNALRSIDKDNISPVVVNEVEKRHIHGLSRAEVYIAAVAAADLFSFCQAMIAYNRMSQIIGKKMKDKQKLELLFNSDEFKNLEKKMESLL